MSAHNKLMRDIHLEDLKKAEQALAACAYWAASGLHPTSNNRNCRRMLENVMSEAKEYAESEPDRDSNIMFEGFEYSYTPVGGWPEPEKEMM